jgi:signal transduction histidine kinase
VDSAPPVYQILLNLFEQVAQNLALTPPLATSADFPPESVERRLLEGFQRMLAAFAAQGSAEAQSNREAYRLLEQRAEERPRELVALLQVSRTVAATLELKPLFDLILDQLKTVVEYNAAAVFRLDQEEVLTLLNYHGPVPVEKLAGRWPLAQIWHVGEVVRRRAPVLIPDLQADTPLAQSWRETARQHLDASPPTVAAWMGVPLMIGDTVIGLLTFDFSQPRHCTPHQADMALTVANQAAVAIENARLYAEAQNRAALEERQKLARELHDSVSQALYGIALGTRTARELLDREPGETRLKQTLAEPLDYILSLAEAGLTEMRALIFELRPESLEVEGLVAALTNQAAVLRARHKLEVETTFGDEPPLPWPVKEALYRVAQEALHNIVKHSRARRVELRLEGKNDSVRLKIKDDGQGFDPQGEFPGHLGLRSMRERVERLGGAFEIESAPGQGTRLDVQIPNKKSNEI